ncbi:MAG: hypothetical protein FJY85_20110, partial [Deltaproteobacteria bacterium]|nr:hypothetical protein [Deltaproteobacteria bacterium]
ILTSVAWSSLVQADGEAILGLTGQYTFFIKPEPGSPCTYYQKMVPCVLEETVPIPRQSKVVFPVPEASRRGMPVLRSETPVGCADGSGPCLHCFPKPSCRPATSDVVIPVMRQVSVPILEVGPRCVKKRVMRPQWFEVTDIPRPPKGVRKVHAGG